MSNFFDYIKAGYPCIWVETHEEDRCIKALARQAPMYEIYSWDLISGLKCHQPEHLEQNTDDPLSPILKAAELPDTCLLFLKDYHKFISSVEVFRALLNQLDHLKAHDKHIIMVSPVTDIPVEMEKHITVMDFALPTVAEMTAVARQMVEDNELSIEVDESAMIAGKGLTLAEAESAMARSIITTGRFDRGVMEEAKLQAVRKAGVMELYMPEPEENLGGLDPLKQYLHNRKSGFADEAKPTPQGILLAGLPGAGKSLTAKVTASVFGFPLLKLDIAGLKGSLVGESEQRIKQATQLADAIGECVIWIDEIEKSLGGVQSSSKTDGGTTAAMFGHLLTWMQETKSHAYIVATCNDMDDLLNISQGALLRRFDDIWFVDVPTATERALILEIMNRKYKTEISPDWTSQMRNWTGAEIEKFVKASVYDGEDMAFANIRPIFEQNKTSIETVRTWARNNARLANAADGKAGDQKVRRLNIS